MNGMIIVLSGPSGAGKGRLFDEIARTRKNVFNKGFFLHGSPDRSNRTVNSKGSCHKGASL